MGFTKRLLLVALLTGIFVSATLAKVEYLIERIVVSNRTKNSVWDYSNMKLTVRRGKLVMKGTFELIHGFNDEIEGRVDLFKFQGNEYRTTPFRIRQQAICDFLDTDDFIYPPMVSDSDLPAKCPVPRGSYIIDHSPDLKNLQTNFEGKYLAVVQMFYRKRFSDTIKLYYDIQRY